MSRGYIGNADKQAAYFVDMPDGSRLYRSGDLGYQLPSGDIAFLHRKDNQVMVWGRRVEPDGVQRVLCSCGGVKTGAVRAYLDEHGLASYLVAYYVASTDIAEDDLRAEMEKVLPAYMVPERFVELQKMPLTPNGKVDSLALPRVERGWHERGADQAGAFRRSEVDYGMARAGAARCVRRAGRPFD